MSSSSFNVPLNITPYASVDNLPSTANENDIAVITEEEITNWCARSDTPVGTAEGSIWIVTKTRSSVWFNVGSALSPVIIYPAAVRQYLNGAWTYRDAYIYQNGNWTRIVYYLYDSGEEYSAITGGWKIVNASGGNGVKNASNMYLGYSGSSNRFSIAYTNNTIDSENLFDTLYIKYNIESAAGNGLAFGLSSNNTDNNKKADVLVSSFLTATGDRVAKLDISSIDGEYYISISVASAKAYIYSVWMQ